MWSSKTSKYSWSKAYTEIKKCHDEAFRAIDEAITLEEREKPKEAIEKYKEGIQLIDQALSVQVQCTENPDITWEKACGMIQKVKRTRAEVLLRINSIQSSKDFKSNSTQDNPPSYEEATSSSENEVPRTYGELAEALNDINVNIRQMEEEIIYFHENVRLYFISPNGEVLSTQEPQVLKIFLVQGKESNTLQAVLQIGTFIYPLVSGVSPCYRTNYGAFILPNLNTETPGASIGIILPSEADDEVFDLLESILYGIISQPTGDSIANWRSRREAESPEDYSIKISNKIVNGAWYLSQGLIRGAMKAGEYFTTTATPKIINSISSVEQAKDIPEPLVKSIKIAETTTNKAAKVTEFVAGKIGEATVRLGQYLAPHIQTQGTKLLTTGFKLSEVEASNKMKRILTVAAGAVEGFGTVYRGLETSAIILGNSLKDNTVKIVEHKYGQPASVFADNTCTTVGNVFNIVQNAKIMTPKGIAKRTAKDTGKAMVYGYTSSYRGKTAYEQTLTNDIRASSSSQPV